MRKIIRFLRFSLLIDLYLFVPSSSPVGRVDDLCPVDDSQERGKRGHGGHDGKDLQDSWKINLYHNTVSCQILSVLIDRLKH
jgi:hypothetical protein